MTDHENSNDRGDQPAEGLDSSTSSPEPEWDTRSGTQQRTGVPASTFDAWSKRQNDPIPWKPGPRGKLFLVEAVRAENEARMKDGRPTGFQPGGGPRRRPVTPPGGAPGDHPGVPGDSLGITVPVALGGDDEELTALGREVRREQLLAAKRRLTLREAIADAEDRGQLMNLELEQAKVLAELNRVRAQGEADDGGADGNEEPSSYADELARINRRGQALGRQAVLVGRVHLSSLVAEGVLDQDFADLLLDELPCALGLQFTHGFQPLADAATTLATICANLSSCVESALESMLAERGIPTGGRR